MIFADKLIALRKKSGWSQEDLAIQMNVSRQSVSKWEGAQSIPDLEKIIRLSKIFGVSTDYLLKDEIEDPELIQAQSESSIRSLSLEQANEYLSIIEETNKSTAYAVVLCILSPICLLLLGGLSELKTSPISENVAAGFGLIILLLFVAVAVAIFISNGNKTHAYDFLNKETFEPQYGMIGMVKERQNNYRPIYNRGNTIGTILCILAAIPLFIGIIINEENDFTSCISMCLTLVIVAIGVFHFVKVGSIWESYNKLLQAGDYTKEKKNIYWFATVYWLIITAIFLGYSFITNNWGYSWIIWVMAGICYPALHTLLSQKKKGD